MKTGRARDGHGAATQLVGLDNFMRLLASCADRLWSECSLACLCLPEIDHRSQQRVHGLVATIREFDNKRSSKAIAEGRGEPALLSGPRLGREVLGPICDFPRNVESVRQRRVGRVLPFESLGGEF